MHDAENIAENGGSQHETEDDHQSMNRMPKCHRRRERWDSNPGQKPTGQKPNPPSGQKANLGNEDPRRQTKIRISKLRKLQAAKEHLRGRIRNLVMERAVNARKNGSNRY